MRMLENIAVWVAVGLAVSTGGTALAAAGSSSSAASSSSSSAASSSSSSAASSSSSSAASSSSSSAASSSSCATTTDTNSLNYTACNTIPVIDRLASQVCSPQQFFDSNGVLQTGTVNCSTGTTIANCTTNNASGCIATTTFKAGDLTNLVAGNIKGGVTVAGVAGTYGTLDPWDFRPGFTVNGTSSKLKVNCRNAANLATFDIDAGQSVTSVTTGSPGVFNITAHGLANGTAVRLNYTTAPAALDNTSIYYVVNSSTNSFQLSATSGGAGISVTTAGANVTVHRWKASPAVVDIWDTIDDYNGLPASTGFPSTWSVANNYCGGVEATSGDDNVWKDVTTTNGTTGSTCAATPANCTMQDKISGLKWSKFQSTMSWWSAVKYCNASTYNGQLPGSWRLPTQKELMSAYDHGISSAASTNWMTLADMNVWFSSASSHSPRTYNSPSGNLATGETIPFSGKGFNRAVVCVQ